MSALPLAGPSSPLRTNSAEVRRVVNWEPIRIESGTGKGGAQTYLKQCAGLRHVASLGSAVRALKARDGRLFAVTDELVEVASDWTTTSIGSIAVGDVSIDDNETQIGIAAGYQGYAYDLLAGTLSAITTNWPGAKTLGVLAGYGVIVPPNSNHFYLTSNQDFTVLDPLQFASAETSPGDIVGSTVKHQQLLLLKERSGEIWYDAGSADFPLARDDSAVIEVGCAAGRTLCKLGGIAYWLGRDEDGTAIVFGMAGYAPQRISSDALEEKLSALEDLSGASAWVFHQEGQSRYVLNVPGLETTWIYNVAAGIWHERGEWDDGWTPWRATCHAVAFGKHIVGDAAGNLYEMTPTVNTYGSEVMRRNWISPHNANPGLAVQRYDSFEVVCDTGEGLPSGYAPTLLMRYSNDGGRRWENWIELPLGITGDSLARARDTMLGSGRDRVWEIVVTDDVVCNPVTVLVNER
jgi:hypothetical protein